MKRILLLLAFATPCLAQMGGGPLTGGGGSGAPTTNPAGGANNYAPIATPTFTGTATADMVRGCATASCTGFIIGDGNFRVASYNFGVISFGPDNNTWGARSNFPWGLIVGQASGDAPQNGLMVGNAGQFQISGAGIPQMPLVTPASSSATCTAGQFQHDAGYVYVCTATNTWKRAALNSF